MVFALGLDKISCVHPFGPSNQGSNDVGAEPFAIAYDGVLCFSTQVVYEIDAEIDAAQLIEESVYGLKKLFAGRCIGDDGIYHLMMTGDHFVERRLPPLVSLYGQARCGEQLIGNAAQCAHHDNHGLAFGLVFYNSF